jgi:clan AA aspartic protease (TIGR02281 family)
MTCPRCKIPLRLHYNYCPHCGADLRARPDRNRSLTLAIAGFAILCGSVFILMRAMSPTAPREIAFHIGTSPHRTGPQEGAAAPAVAEKSGPTAKNRPKLPVGTVMIRDITGELIVQIPAAIVDRGWLALPAAGCLGGYSWHFRSQGADLLEIVGGIIGENDAVGIWQLQPDASVTGPRLGPHDESKSLEWVSIVSERKLTAVTPREWTDRRYTTQIFVPEMHAEAGIFMQEGQVVGWTFGSPATDGYLWRGLDGENLVYDISVDDYYRSTFENSREEQLLLALTQKDAAADQLRAIASAFLLRPVAGGAAAFPQLQPGGAVIPRMRALIDRLRRGGRPDEVADAFDDRILVATGDTALALDVTGAVQEVYGFGAAVELIENVLADPSAFHGATPPQLDQTHRRLYRQWLSGAIRGGDLQTAQLVSDRASSVFTRDPHIHLLRVELALALDDWRSAERLLRSLPDYPDEMSGQVKAVQSQIAALKSEAEKIVIRFAPGSQQIPVTAALSPDVQQGFVVDTGASMVTIPRATAQKLGLTNGRNAVRRQVYTAGGIVEAELVVLPFIELGGWQLDSVEALVLDLPNQPDVGLLGLNYLRRFRMDLNSERGVLTLKPR